MIQNKGKSPIQCRGRWNYLKKNIGKPDENSFEHSIGFCEDEENDESEIYDASAMTSSYDNRIPFSGYENSAFPLSMDATVHNILLNRKQRSTTKHDVGEQLLPSPGSTSFVPNFYDSSGLASYQSAHNYFNNPMANSSSSSSIQQNGPNKKVNKDNSKKRTITQNETSANNHFLGQLTNALEYLDSSRLNGEALGNHTTTSSNDQPGVKQHDDSNNKNKKMKSTNKGVGSNNSPNSSNENNHHGGYLSSSSMSANIMNDPNMASYIAGRETDNTTRQVQQYLSDMNPNDTEGIDDDYYKALLEEAWMSYNDINLLYKIKMLKLQQLILMISSYKKNAENPNENDAENDSSSNP